ncbi:hypothetical protein L7F22_061694 [Adiantum nelumboides]|nr:hypothetical protein [Adiantum nelumboides]
MVTTVISLARPLAAVRAARLVLRASKESGYAQVHMKRRGGALFSTLSQKQEVGEEELVKSRTLSPSMLSKLGQMLNPAGIASAAHVVLREPQIALPHVEVSDICSIDWNALRLSGFKGVVLDKDNTITAPYVQSIWPSLASSLNDCKKAFEGRVALLSNSAVQGCINMMLTGLRLLRLSRL